MEGYSTWYYLNKTPLHPYFKYSSEKVAPYFYPVLTGVAQTFADSMNFQYVSPIDYAVFSFEPKPPAYATFTNMDITPGNLEIVYDGADYKTIGTFLEFSSLVGTNEPSTRKTLMKRYLDFFQVSTAGPFAYFHVSNVMACTKKAVSFIDDSFDNITSRSWEFPGGTPASSTAINPEVVYQNPGKYDVKLTVSDGLHVKTILRKSYITVEQCTGMEQPASQPEVRIYPNPASEDVKVALPGDIQGSVTITLFDFSGRIVKVMQSDASAQNQVFTIGLSDLRRGLYYISIKNSKGLTTRKLMLN